MNKPHIVGVLISILGICMIVIALIIVGVTDTNSFVEYSGSDNQIITTSMNYTSRGAVKEVAMTSLQDSEIVVAKAAQGNINSGETVDEVAAKLNRYLGTDLLQDKGNLIASYAISLGVDPYVAASIMLLETGCGSRCSALARNCNNVAGQKGSPSCNGSYKRYDTLDDGIRGAIDNLSRNYYSKGLTTVEAIGPKYAESNTWVPKVNNLVNRLKN